MIPSNTKSRQSHYWNSKICLKTKPFYPWEKRVATMRRSSKISQVSLIKYYLQNLCFKQFTLNCFLALFTCILGQNSGPVPFKSNIIGELKEIHQQVCKKQAAAPLENYIVNRRRAVRDKAMASTKAEYRGSRKVLTAMDLEDDSESDWMW